MVAASRRSVPFVFLFAAVSIAISTARADTPVESLLSRPLHPGKGTVSRGPRSEAGAQSFPDALPVFHNHANLVCSDCHIAHASKHHANPAAPVGGEELPVEGPANPNLLRTGDPLDLCLTCHDGRGFAPDVVGTDANGLTQRSAGFFDEPAVINIHGHDLGRNLPRDDGFGLCTRCHFSSGEDRKVTCIDCHDPHGNGVARNLQWASYPEGTPDLGLFVNPTATGLARYEAANVSYGSLNTGELREVTNMCVDCHHVFSGDGYIDADGNGIHERHPTSESERGSLNSVAQGGPGGTTVPAHWEAGTGSGFTTPRVRFVQSGATGFVSATTVDATTNGVFCLTCHRAHGSDQAFGMAWPLQNGYNAVGCDQCHLKADAP